MPASLMRSIAETVTHGSELAGSDFPADYNLGRLLTNLGLLLPEHAIQVIQKWLHRLADFRRLSGKIAR